MRVSKTSASGWSTFRKVFSSFCMSFQAASVTGFSFRSLSAASATSLGRLPEIMRSFRSAYQGMGGFDSKTWVYSNVHKVSPT